VAIGSNSHFEFDRLYQRTAVANHRHSEVQGAAHATAAVTVNGASPERLGGFPRR
jgi:hypothetical protein